MAVSPQRQASRMASWINTYCSWETAGQKKREEGKKNKKRKVYLQSHTNAPMRLPTVNCTLVKNNAEFNYCCRRWTNGCSRRVFVTSPCLFLRHCLRAQNCMETRWQKKKKEIQKLHITEGGKNKKVQKKKHCPHRAFKKKKPSRAEQLTRKLRNLFWHPTKQKIKEAWIRLESAKLCRFQLLYTS